ncbi:hypothetical protein [uncultured Agitococcus sp.]|uniref:hypothetical protein n=1 Tax=uncultured Agitococcus sp. TaxID=1506599 RepID=UPI002637EDE0|nr:hypothetical protein [uncultured Agitococcus sp.]
MSLRQAAIANNINLSTAKHRIKRGWDKIDALIIPPNYQRKVTDQQVIECEKLGLTIRRSAAFLGIGKTALRKRIERLGINWRGKGRQIGAKQ